MSVDGDRLGRLLGGDELAWLVERMRRRLAQGRALTGSVTRRDASAQERAAVARLLGRPVRPGASVTLTLDEVEAVVRRAGAAPDLTTAVESLVGPVADEVAARAAADRAWERTIAQARAWTAPAGLDGWLEDVSGSGLLRRQAGGDVEVAARLLGQVAAVVARLPADGVPLARFAADALGDSKALANDRPVTALAVQAAACVGGTPGRDETQTPTVWRREVWAGVGVLAGELSAPVLTLGLPGDPRTGTGRVLAAMGERGEPVHLTLRQLIGDPPRLAVQGGRVWVCENPSVVAVAADALAERCAALVCTGGQPSAAVSTLLLQLAGAGAALAYHGDFDWPGIQMTNAALRRFGAAPWRMGTADYRAAAPRSRRELDGQPVGAAWDHALEAAMVTAGVRVEEELVTDDLLTDLAD